MNMVPGSTTPGPHGPQVIPGVYTLKLTVDGQTYAREVTVVNDPRVGQSPETMAALRAQNKLATLTTHAMEQSYNGHDEVEAITGQIASLVKGSIPSDVARQADTLNTSLRKIAGVLPPPGAFTLPRLGPPDPKALRSFLDVNNEFNSLISMFQVGMDIPLTAEQIGTWESDCDSYNRTLAAWNDAQKQIADFNAVLVKNQLHELTAAPTKLTSESCAFAPETGRKAAKPAKAH